MWLPKDERKVLSHYYRKLHGSGVETRGRVFLSELEKCLPGKDKRNRVKIASRTLKKRDLLAFLNDQADAITVQLSIEGYDLGRRCNSWCDRNVLWFREYKDHWIWIIISFLGGVVGALLVNWLTRGTGGE
ncbi:MAG: hypothetical protein ACYSWO_16435 [Planctomycetota bacterium]